MLPTPDAVVVDDIEGLHWSKLLVNLFNGVLALTPLNITEAFSDRPSESSPCGACRSLASARGGRYRRPNDVLGKAEP